VALPLRHVEQVGIAVRRVQQERVPPGAAINFETLMFLIAKMVQAGIEDSW